MQCCWLLKYALGWYILGNSWIYYLLKEGSSFDEAENIFLFHGTTAEASCNHPPLHWSSYDLLLGGRLASNKTVTVGKHFTLVLKTTTLQGPFLSAAFQASSLLLFHSFDFICRGEIYDWRSGSCHSLTFVHLTQLNFF